MTFASDRLYKGYLLRNMATIVSRVKVREVMPHLPCLTDHDRENIEAKRETCGNFDSMVLLLDCLKRRENWPEEFVAALEECNHPTLAADIRRAYQALGGNSNPRSPSAAVTRAHVHPPPSATHLSTPESEAAVPQPAEASAPPQPAAPASPPAELPPEASGVAGPPSPEPVGQPRQPALLDAAPGPTTPPPSPEVQPAPHAAGGSPPPQREGASRQEPVENSELEDTAVIPDAPQPSASVERPDRDAPSRGEDLRKATTPTPRVRSPPSPPAAEAASGAACGTAFSGTTPSKAPVQDTAPPLLEEKQKVPVAARTQDAACRLQPEYAAAAAMEDSWTENTPCLSKPGELLSVPAQPLGGLAPPGPDSSADSYSGNTARLEISAVPENLACVPECSAVACAAASPSSALPCQEDGVGVNREEPEENRYESSSEIPESQEIRENTLQVSEEPSILNLDGREATPPGQILNGEAAKEVTSAAAESVNTPPAGETPRLPKPAAGRTSPPALQDSKKKSSSPFLTTNTKYLVAAAGVGACALLLAWKCRN